jgi:hypothetical protein
MEHGSTLEANYNTNLIIFSFQNLISAVSQIAKVVHLANLLIVIIDVFDAPFVF